MKITCTGALVRWRAAGDITFLIADIGPSLNTVLSIWRERGTESQVYDRVGTITLGFCGNRVAVRGSDSVFECMLPQDSRVSVQTGDIIGMEIMIELGFQILYRRRATETRLRAYLFNIVQGFSSTSVRLSDSDAILIDEPQISLTVEPAAAVDNQTTTITPTVTAHATVFPTNFTPQGGSNDAVKIVGAVAGVVFLIVVIIVFAIKRYRMMFKNKEIENMDTKTVEEASQVSKDMEADKCRDTKIVKTNNAMYGQQIMKDAVQHEEHYYNNIMVNQCEQIPPEKLPCKKENAPTVISNNHKRSASHGLYASPKAKSSSAEVEHRSAARYETFSGHKPAAVDERAGCKVKTAYEQAGAVYEKAVVYEKAAIYERAAIYEQAVTYQKAVMYEKAPLAASQLFGVSQD